MRVSVVLSCAAGGRGGGWADVPDFVGPEREPIRERQRARGERRTHSAMTDKLGSTSLYPSGFEGSLNGMISPAKRPFVLGITDKRRIEP